MEPAFAQNPAVWPMAGFGAAVPEPEDPCLAIPRHAFAGSHTPQLRIAANANAELTNSRDGPLGGGIVPAQPTRRLSLAMIVSCVFHVSAALFFLRVNEEGVLIAGGEQAEMAMLGSAEVDQASSGGPAVNVSLVTLLDTNPVETVEATPVSETELTEATQAVPVETAVSERVEPVEERQPEAQSDTATAAVPERAEPVVDPGQAVSEPPSPVIAQAEPADKAEPAATSDHPEILAVDRVDPVNDANVVQKPAEIAAVAPAETAAVAPADTVQPVEAEQPVERLEPVEPKPKPKAAKPVVEKPATQPAKAKEPRKKAPPKKTAAKGGSSGANEMDARKGQADGTAQGKSAKGQGDRKQATAGNASVSNYPGKVLSKLRRALRYPAAAKREKLRGEVQVSFVVSAGGGVGAIRVVASSGSPILDSAAVETVRRAAPFPAIPDNAGRSSWPFTVPLAFTR